MENVGIRDLVPAERTGNKSCVGLAKALVAGLDQSVLGVVDKVPISQLSGGESPRLRGQDEEHLRTLAASGAVLPPILVHRQTMRVIDGMHRLGAARLRGERQIAVRFFDGTDKDAFIEAVRANTTHGKPLMLAEREAAAERILDSHSEWSDRAIADVCGLSSKTVAAVRRRSSNGLPPADTRVGRDGRLRPVDSMSGRRLVAALLREHPNASLREIARAAGVSPGTVRSVRDELRRKFKPLETPRQADQDSGPDAAAPNSSKPDIAHDAAFTSTDEGRALLTWLGHHHIDKSQWTKFVNEIPVGRLYVVAEIVRERAACWIEFAECLESRARSC